MGWEEININDDAEAPESIDDCADDLTSKIPDDWAQTYFAVRNYVRSYDIGITVDIFVMEDYFTGTYKISSVIKDSDTLKKFSEQDYDVSSEEAMKRFVLKLIQFYDGHLDKKEKK